jgi:2-methylcitrate dehydratase PrpD
MPTLAHRLAEYAVGLEFERLPEAVVHEVKRRTIDSIGCALGALNAEPCVRIGKHAPWPTPHGAGSLPPCSLAKE